MPNVNPEVTASLRSAGVDAGLTPEKLLVVAQQSASSTAASGALTTNILNDGAEDTLYGRHSPIAHAIRRIRRNNPYTQIDAIGIDDAYGSNRAAATLNFTGTATEAGQFVVSIGSEKFNSYTLPVASGDTAASLATSLETIIAASSAPLYASATEEGLGAITFDAAAAGTYGNDIGIKVIGSVGGITYTLDAMEGGQTDPDLTGVLDVIGEERYQGIAWQFLNDLDTIKDFLDARFNAQNKILDGRAFAGAVDTQANLLTLGNTHNSNSLCIAGYALVSSASHKGANVLEHPFIGASEFAAIRALRRTEGAILGRYVTSRSPKDSFGGIGLNSKPYFNTPFFDQAVADVGTSFTELEIRQLEDAGIWVADNNPSRTGVIAGRVKTTSKTDNAGNPDPTFGALNYVDTSTAARELFVNRTRARYVQFRATAGALIPDYDSANNASIAAFVSEVYADLAQDALVIDSVGEDSDGNTVDYGKLFKENLNVTLNTVTGKFFVSAKLYIVNQLTGVVYDFAVALEA